jgi:hypothetical protein
VKLNSWPEIGSDGDVLLMPYVPKGITGYDDEDESTSKKCVIEHNSNYLFSSKIAWYYWRVYAYCCTVFYLLTCMNISQH